MIKGDPVSRDPLKRLTVARRDDLQQHAALGVDLQHVALGLAAELVQLKHARGTALIRQPRDRSRGDRLAAGQTSESGGRESQRPKQRRGIKHQRDLLAVAVAQRQVTLIAVRAVALVPRPPGVAITDHVGTVAQAALVLYADTILSAPDTKHPLVPDGPIRIVCNAKLLHRAPRQFSSQRAPPSRRALLRTPDAVGRLHTVKRRIGAVQQREQLSQLRQIPNHWSYSLTHNPTLRDPLNTDHRRFRCGRRDGSGRSRPDRHPTLPQSRTTGHRVWRRGPELARGGDRGARARLASARRLRPS